MCVRRDTSLAAGQRCSLDSPPPSSASNSPRVCLLAWIPNTFCRSRNTPGKLIVVRITPPPTPPPAESYLRQHLNLKRKKPPAPLFPPSPFSHCTNMGVPRVRRTDEGGGGEGESVALTKWAGRVCATELNSSVKSDCTPSHGGRGSENEPLVAG